MYDSTDVQIIDHDHASAEHGFVQDLIQLHKRTQENYTLKELEQLLSCFEVADVDWDADSEVGARTIARAYTATVILLEVAVACENKHTLAASTGKQLLPSLNGILFWMCAVLSLRPKSDLSLPEGITKLDVSGEPKPHDVFASVLVRLADLHPSLETLIIFHPLVVDLSLFWWVATRDGHPLLYTSGSHNSTSDDESGRDAIASLAYLISYRNSQGFSIAIDRGDVCSAELFFTRASERMQLLIRLPTLPHLKHIRGSTLETENFQCIIGAVNALIGEDPQLLTPLLKTAAPQKFMEALVAARLQGLFADSDTRRAEIERDILKFARIVAAWGSLSSRHYVSIVKGFVSDRRTRITHLLRDFMSVCTTTTGNPQNEPFDILFQDLLRWALASPTTLKHVHDAFQTDFPKIGLTVGTIASEKRSACLLHGIHLIARHNMSANSTAQFDFCDNANHRALRSTVPKKDGQGTPSMTICSGCLSVTYCSQRCQKEDWGVRHRAECGKMRADYFKVRYSKGLRYSQRWRAFHVSILQSSHEQNSTVFKPRKTTLRDAWSRRSDYMGRKFVLTIDPADVTDPVSIDPIPEFVKATAPLIPKHLFKRFKDLLEAFMRPDSAGSSPGEHSLVNGTFYYGDMEMNHLVLVRRVPDAPDKSTEVEHLGSVMYTCPTRDRFASRGGVGGHQARNYELLFGPNDPGLKDSHRRSSEPIEPQGAAAVLHHIKAIRIRRRERYQTSNLDDDVVPTGRGM